MDKQFNELVKPLRQAVAARTQNGQVYIDLAVLHAAYGFYDAAEAAFARLMEPDQMGRDPHLLNLYARYFWESRDTLEGYDQAKKVYEDVLAAHPADPKEAKATEEVAKQGIERVARERKSLEESLALDPKPTSRQ
jgi:tetratricopeptide (TPR) repeat protein